MHEIRCASFASSLLMALLLGACGTDEPPVIDPVEPPPDVTPRIDVFAVIPATIDAGGAATLRWRTQNVKSLTLIDGSGEPIPLDGLSIEDGSIDVRPVATTSYLLTATGSDASVGPSVREVTIAVREKPEIPAIAAFDASPETVARGAEVALSWETTGATLVTIRDDAGAAVDLGSAGVAQGQVRVKPSRLSTTYTLIADGPGGRDTAEARVTVADLPRVVRFDVSPLSPVQAGGTVTLNWATSNAASVVIERDGEPLTGPLPGLTGSRTFTLSDNAVFALAATNEVGTVDARAEAKVGPRIAVFSSSAWVVRKNEEITLRWELADADRATIEGPGRAPFLIEGVDVASGAVTWTVTQSGDFVLRAFRGDVSLTSVVGVDVTATPRIRSFRPERLVVSAANDIPGSVKLHWDQTGAHTCTIYRSNLPVPGYDNFACEAQGTAEITILNSGRLRFEARNDDGIDTATTDIEARRPASVVAFAATPARRLTPGDPVALSWEVDDAVSVGIAVKDGPSLPIDPLEFKGTHEIDEVFGDTTYILTVTNVLGDAFKAELTVRAGAPKLLDVALAPAYLAAGVDKYAISWKSDGGDLLTVTEVGGSELLRIGDENLTRIDNGSIADLVAPSTAGPHEYTVRVENTRGGLFDEKSVKLEVTDGPIITSFTSNRTEVAFGQTLTLGWALRNPSAVTPTLKLVDDCGNDYSSRLTSSSTSLVITPTEPPAMGHECTYTLTAEATGRMPHSRTVTVKITLPLIFNSFNAAPDRVRNDDNSVNDGVELTWGTQYGVELEIFVADEAGTITSAAIHRVDDPVEVAAGRFKVNPTSTTRYLARLRNILGAEEEKWVRVWVDPPAMVSFVADPDVIVQGETSTLSWKAKTAAGVWVGPSLPDVTRLGNTYVDISGFGETLAMGTGYQPTILQFPPGFVFPFRGVDRTSIKVSDRGWAGFTLTGTSQTSVAVALPDTARLVNFALYQAELDYSQNNQAQKIYYGMHADGLGDCFIIQWAHRSRQDFSPVEDLNFQLVLRPNGDFEYRYGVMIGDKQWPGIEAGLNASIGFQYDNASWPGMNVVPFKTAVAGLANAGWAFRVARPAEGSMVVTPQSTTTYTATAIGQGVTDSKPAAVEVWRTPVIGGANVPSEVKVNQQFSITWTGITNAVSARVLRDNGVELCIIPSTQFAAGSCTVTEADPGVKTYYIEIVNGPARNVVERWLATNVRDIFVIDDFRVEPTEFPIAGETVTFFWETRGAAMVELQGCEAGVFNPVCTVLTPGLVNPASGSFETQPLDRSVEFKLKACDVSNQCIESKIGVYIGAGSLDTLDASPITQGGGTTLSWTSTNQDYVKFESPIAPIEVSDGFIALSAPGATPATLIGTANDGFYDVVFPGGFTFPWFGEKKTALRASTDGWITFNMEHSASQVVNGTNTPAGGLPTKADTNLTNQAVQFAPFWNNMVQSAGRPLRYQLFSAGDPKCGGNGERCLAVEWAGFEIREDASSGTGGRRCTPDGINPGSDMNIQVVLFESGMFDFRYGTMTCVQNPIIAEGGNPTGWSGRSDTVIGWQSSDRYEGQMLVARRTRMSGGLQGRSWRFPVQMAANGSITIKPTATTTYRLCASNASYYPSCKSITVEVN